MRFRIINSDSLSALVNIETGTIDCCVTSPPYWGLRDYGHAGQIGIEPTPDEFMAKLVAVFREVRRVLKPEGTCWVNMGDSYAATTKGSSGKGDKQISNAGTILADRFWSIPDGLKPKDLVGIPWMLAFALRADGWYLRQDIIWHKPNPMPESVKDRFTKAHEYVFLLTKSARYWWDAAAMQEAAVSAGKVVTLGEKSLSKGQANGANIAASGNGRADSVTVKETRNRRSVWTLAAAPTPEAHFATFPIELPELCILAGCPVDGIVLDPFSGAGTTGLAALKNGRRYIGIEINPEYVNLTRRRAERIMPLLLSEWGAV